MFDDLLQSAMQQKQAEVDASRPKFRAAPMYLQGTLFETSEEILRLRKRPLAERLEVAAGMRQAAGQRFRDATAAETAATATRATEAMRQALKEYERAYGLFVYIERRRQVPPAPNHELPSSANDVPSSHTKRPNGTDRQPSFTDADLMFQDDISSTTAISSSSDVDVARAAAVPMVVNILCNYAICAAKQGLEDVADAALEEAHRRDPDDLRAAFLLAKRLGVQKVSAGTTDLRRAIDVLSRAVVSFELHQRTNAATTVDTAAAPPQQLLDARQLLSTLQTEHSQLADARRRLAHKYVASCSSPVSSSVRSNSDAALSPSDEAPPLHASQWTQQTSADSSCSLEVEPWFAQAAQCRIVVQQLRSAGRISEAESLFDQLREAAADKFFAEWMVPRQWFWIGGGKKTATTSTSMPYPQDAATLLDRLGIDPLNDPAVRKRLRRLRRHYFVVPLEDGSMGVMPPVSSQSRCLLDLLGPLEMETELLSAAVHHDGVVVGKEKAATEELAWLSTHDAKNRANELFVTKTAPNGPVSSREPLFTGLFADEVRDRTRRLRSWLTKWWAAGAAD